ncbi:MAG: winged helix-turn-helix domain-containing protein [Candidatus Nezhaarchaeales archaeon]
MSATAQSLMDRISKLRSIDKVVDLSRSSIQLEIMFLLSSRGELTAHEIARIMGQRRKSITDALRKLKLKDVVEEVDVGGERLYKLSPFGEKCLNSLLEATGLKSLIGERQSLYRSEGLENVVKNMALSYYVFESIVAAGLARRKIDASRLAKIVNLSSQRLQAYLDVFTGDANPKLFRKYNVPTKLSNLLQKLRINYKRTRTVYVLTDEGIKLFLRSPQYVKLKSSKIYRVLSLITGSCHPKEMWQRLFMLMYLCASLSVASAIFFPAALLPILGFFNFLGLLAAFGKLKNNC